MEQLLDAAFNLSLILKSSYVWKIHQYNIHTIKSYIKFLRTAARAKYFRVAMSQFVTKGWEFDSVNFNQISFVPSSKQIFSQDAYICGYMLLDMAGWVTSVHRQIMFCFDEIYKFSNFQNLDKTFRH